MSIEITVADLWTTAQDDYTQRVPISEVRDWEWHHIHGRLTIRIKGREVPHLGFWGPDDVCLDTWVPVFRELMAALSPSEQDEYTWDEGEQGQPAFRWVRSGDEVRFSIVASSISDGHADPDWQDVPFSFGELREQIDRFLAALHDEIERQAPAMAAAWWKEARKRMP